MGSLFRFGLVGGILLLLAPLMWSADPADPIVEQLVADLGSPEFTKREKASDALWKMGDQAKPALLEALKNPDAEVADRAKEILDKFAAGNFFNTPPEVLKHIRDFRSGILDQQFHATTALLKLGDTGVPALRALLGKDLGRDNRAPVFDHLRWLVRNEVPLLILAGKLDQAEAILALETYGPVSEGLLDYVTFLHLRDREKQAIPELEVRRKARGETADAAARALVFVYRAAGEKAKAKALAAEIELTDPQFRDTVDSLLEDFGEWSQLAERTPIVANSFEGLKIFRLRLAGKTKQANELAERQKDSDLRDTDRTGTIDSPTLAMMMNDMPLQGIERMKAQRNAPHILADVLSARLLFQEALDLLDPRNKKIDGALGTDLESLRPLYGARRGRILAQLGQRDEAAQVFEQVAEQIAASPNPDALVALIRAEVRSGRQDLACEHLGRAIAKIDAQDSVTRRGQDDFELIFDADADAARYLWRVLYAARPANESPGATMQRVRALLLGTAPAAEREKVIKTIRQEIYSAESPVAQTQALILAALERAAGNADQAIRELSTVADKLAAQKLPVALEDAATRLMGRGSRAWIFGVDESFRFWVELGDLLTEQGRHKEAADRLEQGWKLTPNNPVLLYLSGRCLVKAGSETEGRKRQNLSHWVALGNARMRGRFLEELNNRGCIADAKREWELVRETAWVNEIYIGNVWNQVGRAALLNNDYDAAAAANRKSMHYLLRTRGVSYIEGFAYLTVPQMIRGYTARGLLADGKVDEALALANQCLEVIPNSSELVVNMVPELEKRGRKKDADALFQRVWASYDKLLTANPNSAWARSSAAWLAAGCRRELDTALAYSKKAVELEPNLRGYQETLAEVHFRRGERDQAVTIMKQLVTLDRRNHHYKRQLERYQTGDPTSPIADSDDD